MKVMPIRFVRDIDAATRFYEALGLRTTATQRSGGWLELTADGGILALHRAADEAESTELSLLASEPLEQVVGRLTRAGFEAGTILDESFGRSMRVTDPEGVSVQINEHDTDLYT
ncbi:MAG: VOC family protein [Actinomycetota bacterium]|nr:VOC family protein [Actinomycetota bacterium]